MTKDHIDPIPTVIQGLTDDDYEYLKSLIQSPVYRTLVKIYEDAIVTQYRQMEGAKETKDIFNLQGRINGLRYAQNAPKLLVKQHEEFTRNKSDSEARFSPPPRGGLKKEKT